MKHKHNERVISAISSLTGQDRKTRIEQRRESNNRESNRIESNRTHAIVLQCSASEEPLGAPSDAAQLTQRGDPLDPLVPPSLQDAPRPTRSAPRALLSSHLGSVRGWAPLPPFRPGTHRRCPLRARHRSSVPPRRRLTSRLRRRPCPLQLWPQVSPTLRLPPASRLLCRKAAPLQRRSREPAPAEKHRCSG